MTSIFVVGVSMTPCGRLAGATVRDLTAQAVGEALADAGLAASAVEAAFFSNCGQSFLEGQHMIAGQIALRAAGIEGIPITNVENACASGATAFHLAYAYLRAGMADVALAVGAEKLSRDDKAKSFALFDGAWDVENVDGTVATLGRLGGDLRPKEAAGAQDVARSAFMDVYASLSKQHMAYYGTTQSHLAATASKNHRHSTFNPKAQYRAPFSVEQILAARVISWPLTLPMCAPISDGAAASILVTGRALARMSGARPVRVDASVLASATSRSADALDRHVCRKAAQRAYAQAGIGPADVSVAEVHDATAFGEILQIENLGLCEPGQGGWLAERGETALGGRIPVNPSGGLECKGHPIGATGLGQIYELVTQLRGEAGERQVPDAKVAVAENGGGFLGVEEAAACVTVLSR